jgi:endo-1,4-beta-xylanase
MALTIRIKTDGPVSALKLHLLTAARSSVRWPQGTWPDRSGRSVSLAHGPAGGDTAYDSVAYQVPVSAGAWTEVSGSYRYGGEVDDLQLYLESPTADLALLVDDASITVTADPPSEEPVYGVVVSSDFEDGTTQGWGVRGAETVAVTENDAHGGAYSLLASGRTDAWNGPARAITLVTQVGVTYQVEAWLKLAPGRTRPTSGSACSVPGAPRIRPCSPRR